MFRLPDEMTEADRKWAGREARIGLGGLLASLPNWLNHPSANAAAEFKPGQLRAAVRAGLTATGHQRLADIYADRALVTQLDGDDAAWQRTCDNGPVSGTPTSSSSQPASMAQMLEDLDLHDGQTVLEVGTGSGYNAALVCERLGAANVTTIDIDPALIHSARDALHRTGYAPTVVVADGGCRLPAARALRPADLHVRGTPDPRILARPDRARRSHPGERLPRTRRRRAHRAHRARRHHCRRTPSFRLRVVHVHSFTHRAGCDGTVRHCGQGPRHPAGDIAGPDRARRRGLPFFAAFRLDVTTVAFQPGGQGEWQTWLLHRDGSWAHHTVEAGCSRASQGGPRRLWSMLETAHEQWSRMGKPARTRFGLSVNQAAHTLWLDSPGGPRWPLE